MRILVVDIGGSHVKLRMTGQRAVTRFDSGPTMTPLRMMRGIAAATAGWRYDRVTVGYPGPVQDDRPAEEPWNLGRGWTRFDFRAAFRCPIRMINDAAMQAIGSYDGGTMLFLGLGTGMGSAMIREPRVLIPLELAHLPYKHGHSYEDYLGEAGMERMGKRTWRKQVTKVIELFTAALLVDTVVIGGGNARLLRELPPHARLGDNDNAFIGGVRLWKQRWSP
jgi:polyphosphate glucokinase